MNEVRSTQIANLALANSASSKGAKETPSSASGKELPQDTVKEAKVEQAEKQRSEPVSAKELQSAVANVEGYVQTLQRDLQFTVDEDLDQTVVKVLDSDSGEVIRQIPDDIFLELARRLKDDGEFRLLNALG